MTTQIKVLDIEGLVCSSGNLLSVEVDIEGVRVSSSLHV